MNNFGFNLTFLTVFGIPSLLLAQPILNPENRVSNGRLQPYAAYFASEDSKEGPLGTFNIGNKKIDCLASKPMQDKNIEKLPSDVENHFKAFFTTVKLEAGEQTEIEFADLRTDQSSRMICKFEFIKPTEKLITAKESHLTAEELVSYFNEVTKRKHEDINQRLQSLVNKAISGDTRSPVLLNGVDESGTQPSTQRNRKDSGKDPSGAKDSRQ